MFIIKGLKFRHLGTSSSHKKFNNEILINRNWHFSWSKFYFLKKSKLYLRFKKDNSQMFIKIQLVL